MNNIILKTAKGKIIAITILLLMLAGITYGIMEMRNKKQASDELAAAEELLKIFPTIAQDQSDIELTEESQGGEIQESAEAVAKTVEVPANWTRYSDTDPQFKVKATMSLPPGFNFSFTGSEFSIMDTATASEIWDFSTSVFDGIDGLKNYYDGTSRRAWYKRKLDGEFLNEYEVDRKRGDIVNVIEEKAGDGGYLVVIVRGLNGNVEKHYVSVSNGIVSIIKPMSEKALLSEAKIPEHIAAIVSSLSVEKVEAAQ